MKLLKFSACCDSNASWRSRNRKYIILKGMRVRRLLVMMDGAPREMTTLCVRAAFVLTTGVHDDAEIGGLSVKVRRSASVVAFAAAATQSTRAGQARRRALCTAAGPCSIPIRRVTAIDQQFTAPTDCCRLT